jgi:chromosome segregation ATPase
MPLTSYYIQREAFDRAQAIAAEIEQLKTINRLLSDYHNTLEERVTDLQAELMCLGAEVKSILQAAADRARDSPLE